MRVVVTMTRTSLPMIRQSIDVSNLTDRARVLCAVLWLACGAAAAHAQTIPADAEPECHSVYVGRAITLSGRYVVDYGDEESGRTCGSRRTTHRRGACRTVRNARV